MQGITIADQTTDGFLAVNLIEILRAIAPVVLTSKWPISNLECFGQAAKSNCRRSRIYIRGIIITISSRHYSSH